MTIKEKIEQYIDDVLSGKKVACKWEKLACKRHRDDLTRHHFPYHFSEARAEHPIQFIQMYCIHVKGELDKQPFLLEPWQMFIIWVIFGWIDDSNHRRFDTVFIEVAKKNGKSMLVAAIGLYMGFVEGEGGAEVYSVANARDQANIVFKNYARAMVVKNPELQGMIKHFSNALVDAETETSTFRALSSDKDSMDGKNVHCAIVDEYHAHKTDEVFHLMRAGMSAREQPMTIVITTAGFDPDVPCVDEEEYTQRVLERRAINETYFGIIFTLDVDDEWSDKEAWPKANPCLGVSKKLKAMEAGFQKAVDMTSEQSKFKNKELNIWTKNRYGWINDADWDAVEKEFELDTMKGAECFAGIDLATVGDTASYSLSFPIDGIFRLYTRIFLPEHDIKEREKRERFDWQEMANAGYCTLTPGRTIDYDFIQAELEQDYAFFNLREIAYDPYNASQFITNLAKLGWEDFLVEFSQAWKFISPAAKDFETKTIDRQIEVFPNPVVSWMVSNTEIRMDANSNIRPVKPDSRKTSKHIDAVFSMMMALDRAVRNKKKKSVYEARGLKTI